MSVHIPYRAVDVNQACTGSNGDYVGLLYPGSELPGFGRSNQVDIRSQDEIADLLQAINDNEPMLAAVSVARICKRRIHRNHAATTQFSGKQIELVSNNVFVPQDAINTRINWSTSINGRDEEGFSGARTLGSRPMLLEPLLYMPDAGLDMNQRYGEIIRARGTTGLYVARNKNVKVYKPGETFNR